MKGSRRIRYPRTAVRRVVYGISFIAATMLAGIIGFHLIEGMNYVNALYFESMLATGQGPPLMLQTSAGKIFASIMAFVSVTSVITTLVFTLGPVLGQLWREGLERGSGAGGTGGKRDREGRAQREEGRGLGPERLS